MQNLISFDEAFVQVKTEVDRILITSPKVIQEYTRHLTLSHGKFIRALSLLTCAQNNDNLIPADAVYFAAAIELLHLATLVHDDVIDDAKTRRGTITLQKKYGKRTAVICGDYLLCAALQAVSGIKRREDYLELDIPNYMSQVCLGELNQHINNGNLDLSVFRYFKIISGKTAALFEASFFSGAILIETDQKVVKLYKRLGHFIGMMFQLTDDCIDFEVSETVAKKPVQSDFEQGIITLPLIFTLKNQEGLKDRLAAGQLSRDKLNDAVFRCGGLRYTHMISKKYYHKAQKILDMLTLSEEKRARLISIMDKAYYGLKAKQENDV